MSADKTTIKDTARGALQADVLIIGSGLAGMLLALKLSQSTDLSVIIASKEKLADSNSSWAQGGVAAVTGANPFDAPDLHYADTIKSGAGLTDPEAAHDIVYGGSRLIKELTALGVHFDKTAGGALDLALEGGHKQARVIHSKDTTGQSITSSLCTRLRAAEQLGRVVIMEDATAIDLLVADKVHGGNAGSGKDGGIGVSGNIASGNVCTGARLLTDKGEITVQARHTVLATGGVGQVFARTTNPHVATGDGMALAYRAGVRLMDMEFVQFHPTALKLAGAPAFLISEAVRGAGATLLDHNGQRFVKRFHEDGELATRDVVSRAIHSVMTEHGLDHVYLDLQPIGAAKVAAKFPNIVSTCAQYGIDVFSEPVPVAPAAHYMMGGIAADTTGHTSMEGLYALGECACTGLHGANRLASNSLLEAGVMALDLADELTAGATGGCDFAKNTQNIVDMPVLVPADLEAFKKQMYRQAGMVRSRVGLDALLHTPSVPVANPTKADYEARNILTVGQLIARAALLREESRGSHLREDFGQTDDNRFAGHYWLSKGATGWTPMVESKTPAVVMLSPEHSTTAVAAQSSSTTLSRG